MKTWKSVMLVVLAVGLLATPAFAQQDMEMEAAAAELTSSESRKAKNAVDNAKPGRLFFVVQQFTGSFADVAGYVDTVQREAEAQGLLKGSTVPTSVLILYEDPTGKDTFRMGVGYQFSSRQNVRAPFTTETLNERRIARFDHRGPYRRLANVHAGIRRQARAKDVETQWPVVQRLLEDPRKVGQDNVRTELLVPLAGGGGGVGRERVRKAKN